MTLISISILISCLSVMAVRGRRGPWPPGIPVARPRLSAAGGTYEGSNGRPSDVYVIQERLIAVADGGGRGRRGHTAAALALGAVVAARPQTAGTEEEDLGGCARAARDELSLAERATGLDLIVLDAGERPRLRYAHVGGGAIWYCAKGGRPRRLTTHGDGPVGTAEPEVGSVPLHQGDRIVVVTNGVVTALGAERMTALFADGRSPASCLDQLYDEMSVVEPEEDATVLVADFVTA
ncbi:SpoIIE family protein phosphatase [Nonomuraea sp. C10]|uniref:SpoIIE family protein phosphatase n=1 Tax=Nonomuraea sp. C10 TaxID=2600577 RepID=UPI0011CD3ABD|nr:SpoIIE family protein phosphatase [Nonomuraea sp. C10]TXK42445.1 SpoIIE family protein phosphatase [Nonomuraea sp. C10]